MGQKPVAVFEERGPWGERQGGEIGYPCPDPSKSRPLDLALVHFQLAGL